MKRSYWPLLATLLATLFFAAPASAQDISLVSCEGGAGCDSGVIGGKSVLGHGSVLNACDSCGTCDGAAHAGCNGCDNCCTSCDSCGGGGGLFAEAEVLFFKYDRADGTRVGADNLERVMGDHEVAPRFSLGWISDSGLGYRMRYFQFDHANLSGNGGAETLGIDTWTLDFELFERFQINRNLSIELSGGVRYNEFDEEMVDSFAPFGPNFLVAEKRINAFDGWGGIMGLQVNRRVGSGSFYGRVRGAIMVNDKFVSNSFLTPDQQLFIGDADIIASTQGMMELAIGYEYNRYLSNGSLLFARLGYEFQTWYNYSSSFAGPVDVPGFSIGESVFTGPADVGFHGTAISIGIER